MSKIKTRIRNNPGNITDLGGPRFAGYTGTYVGTKSKLPYQEFDSKEMGLRALFRNIKSRLNKEKLNKESLSKEGIGPVESTLLTYLGGTKGTKEERYKKASKDNEDPKGYVKGGIKAYNKKGVRGLVEQIIVNENTKPLQDYYLKDESAMQMAEELSNYNLPTSMNIEQAKKFYKFGEFGTINKKKGGMVSNDPYKRQPRFI